jgi:hypothetical protein|nr:MAG TPA: protein of unknown function (DUF3797) [Caudoviricetes sp.]
MIEVIVRDKSGICPRCGKHLEIIHEVKKAYEVTDGGFMRRIISESSSFRAKCRCGFTAPMKISFDGAAIPLRSDDGLGDGKVDKTNPIGKVEK